MGKDASKKVSIVDRKADYQMGQAGSILDGVPRIEDIAALILPGVKTADDLVKVLQAHPRHQRSILLAAQKTLGNAVVTEAVEKLGSSDHMLGADLAEIGTYKKTFREALSTAGPEGGEMVDANAPAPAEVLPWKSKTEWDAKVINQRLGQMDLIAGTDSDNMRCSFATALAMAILDGPAGTVSFLTRFLTKHSPKSLPTDKQRGAMNVLAIGIKAVQNGTASYGDLSWVQEAMHDLILPNDQGGTTPRAEKGMFGQDVGNYFVSQDFNHHDIDQGTGFTDRPKDVLLRAKTLKDGERFVLVWHGTGFDHQVMIANQGGQLYLYDSGMGAGSNHFKPLIEDTLERYFENDGQLEFLTKVDATTA